MTIIPIVIGAFGTVTKELLKGLKELEVGGRVETIQTTVSLRTSIIKYLDLARELKKLWNMKVMTVPIVIGAFGTITKVLLKVLEDLEVGGRIETMQITALLRTARILRRVLET